MKPISVWLAFVIATLLVTSCKESTSPVEPNNNPYDFDIITTFKLVIYPEGACVGFDAIMEDLDGSGGNPPHRTDTILLFMGYSYRGYIALDNFATTPPLELTDTVEALKDRHQFFYTTTGDVLEAVGTEVDSAGKPWGRTFRFTPLKEGTGTLTIKLSHYNSPADKDGVTPSGKSDIVVTYPVVIRKG